MLKWNGDLELNFSLAVASALFSQTLDSFFTLKYNYFGHHKS